MLPGTLVMSADEGFTSLWSVVDSPYYSLKYARDLCRHLAVVVAFPFSNNRSLAVIDYVMVLVEGSLHLVPRAEIKPVF